MSCSSIDFDYSEKDPISFLLWNDLRLQEFINMLYYNDDCLNRMIVNANEAFKLQSISHIYFRTTIHSSILEWMQQKWYFAQLSHPYSVLVCLFVAINK